MSTDTLEGLAPLDEAAFEAKLDSKQEIFIAEYLIDFNCAQASLRTGISAGTGASYLKNPIIASRIRQQLAQRLTRTKITQDQVLDEMALVALSRVDHYLLGDDGEVTLAPGAPEGAMAAIQSIKRKTHTNKDGDTDITVEIKLWDKPKPLQLMGKHVGLFAEKMEHTGKDGGPIETVTRIERVVVDTAKKPEDHATS